MSYIKNILLSADLEKENKEAIAYTIELAKQLGAKVYLLYTYHVPIPATEIDFIDLTPIEEGIILEAKEKFQQIKKDFFYGEYPKYEFLLKPGAVENNIENVLEEKAIDLLVMGTMGTHGLPEIFGSHTSNRIRTVNVPMLVVPKQVEYRNFKNVLYACDLKKLSIHLDLLQTIVQKNHAFLHILTIENKFHVLSLNELITDRIVDHIFSKVEVKHQYVEAENIEEEISRYIEENNINLLVITPHHHNLWERINQKSLSKKLLFHTNIPLLILPE